MNFVVSYLFIIIIEFLIYNSKKNFSHDQCQSKQHCKNQMYMAQAKLAIEVLTKVENSLPLFWSKHMLPGWLTENSLKRVDAPFSRTTGSSSFHSPVLCSSDADCVERKQVQVKSGSIVKLRTFLHNLFPMLLLKHLIFFGDIPELTRFSFLFFSFFCN